MGFGDNIRNLRKEKGMTQDELAELLGYKSFTTIQKWESGVSVPPMGKMRDIAGIFRVSVADLQSDGGSREGALGWDDELSQDAPPHERYAPFIPDGFSIADNYMFGIDGHEDEGELLISLPDGHRTDISLEEMDDILEDAFAFIAYRLNKAAKRRHDGQRGMAF